MVNQQPHGIFLYYLNREAQRSLSVSLSPEETLAPIRILLFSTNDPLYTNFSNLYECEANLLDSTLVKNCLDTGELKIIGERSTYGEFMESRIQRYKFDHIRYPMYFGNTHPLETHAELNLSGSTNYIHQKLLELEARESSARDFVFQNSEIQVFNKSITTITDILKTKGKEGITVSLFETELNSKQSVGSTARLLSAIYIKHYLESLSLDIPIGIRKMAYFEPLARTKFLTNVSLLGLMLKKLGVVRLRAKNPEQFDFILPYVRDSEYHPLLSSKLKETLNILGVCYSQASPEQIEPEFTKALRSAQENEISDLGANPDKILESALMNVELLTKDLTKLRSYREAREGYYSMLDSRLQKILVVTATPVETKALIEVCSAEYGLSNPNFFRFTNFVAGEIGEINGCRLISVQCEAGSGGSSGSQAVVSDAIRELKPDCIILAGIAFGANKKKQALGNILVSTQIMEYEKSKIRGSEIISRGEKVSASPKPLSVFRAAESIWKGEHIDFGLILTGEKLVNSKAFLSQLSSLEKEFIGGEMEGAGIRSTAYREKIDWIVVKSIVDWGYNKTSGFQPTAARNVFQFILFAISKVGF